MASDPQTRARQMAWDVDPSPTPNQTGITIQRLIRKWNRAKQGPEPPKTARERLMDALSEP